MRVYIQWAKADPEDWLGFDLARLQNIRNLPKKGVPTASSVLDNNPGWLLALNCQGVVFEGYDHVAIELLTEGLRITGWQDDPEDWLPGTRFAIQYDFLTLAPDPRFGGAMNTRQARRVWAEPQAGFPSDSLPWGAFAPPPTNLTFHGIWLSDSLYQAHYDLRTPRGWREWL